MGEDRGDLLLSGEARPVKINRLTPELPMAAARTVVTEALSVPGGVSVKDEIDTGVLQDKTSGETCRLRYRTLPAIYTVV